MKQLSLALIAVAGLALNAAAVLPTRAERSDAKRFGLNRLRQTQRARPSEDAKRAFGAFNAARGGKWKVDFSPRTGLPNALHGDGEGPRPGRPEDAARSFLTAHQDLLGVDAATLRVDRQTEGAGHRHLLYRQSYKGIPVEFTGVKVHLGAGNAVTGVHSSYEPNIVAPTNPSVSPDAAGATAVADAGGGTVRGNPTLVIVPLEADGKNHLAWKMRVDSRGGAWRYYVDAVTGQVLFRYSIDRYVGCLSSGVVTGAVYDVDPSTTPGPTIRQFNDQYVYVGLPPQRVVTGNDTTFGKGFFCAPVFGKVTMSLQGPYVNVSQFRGPSAHYDNGNGTWHTVASPVSSPHPYANSSVAVSTINIAVAAPTAVKFLPVFSNFKVGGFSGGQGEGTGDVSDDDQLFIYDANDNPIASYIGNRGPFNGAAVQGQLMHLALRSNESGTNNGYDIAVSSYLTLTNPTLDGAPLSSHTWVAADTSLNLHSEMSLFYHINKMHEYFFSDVNKSSAAPVVKPVVVMAHVGPDLVNAFYDPDYDDLYFGDVSSTGPQDLFADDATVPHHEYTHYIVEKIWSIQNFGQAGAISEALADYFSASSLDHPSIGTYVLSGLNLTGALRELDCVNHSPCYQLGNALTPWAGEIHDDSPFISQALWDVRRDRIQNLGYANGRSCADGLVFQSLLFFPESFAEFYQAMLQVDKIGAVTACGGANATQAVITTAFGNHGLIPVGGDAYEPNDGFGSATDISTLTAVSATLYPTADVDFYSFGAGPGLVQVTLSLPSLGGGEYKGYQLKLYNSARQLVASAAPPYNGFGTIDGLCDLSDCNTTSGQVVLAYNNPSGGLLYAQVIGGDSFNGSNSGVNSTTPYGLRVSFPQNGALSGSIVTAKFDNDVISFSVNVSTFVSNQDWRFSAAQLRDQAYKPLPNTLTHVPASVGDYLSFVSSTNAYGVISGRAQLVPGFAARFPAAGTVFLEVFGYDVHGSTSSLGLSNPINLSANQTELTAFNNIFNPALGQKATVKYAVDGPGHLSVKLYTNTGRYVTTLFDGEVPAGKGSVDWDGRNTGGSTVASGVYVVRADGPGLRTTQKIVVVK